MADWILVGLKPTFNQTCIKWIWDEFGFVQKTHTQIFNLIWF